MVISEAAQIRAVDVNKVFGAEPNQVVALKDIDLEIRPGEFVCLLGPSGFGKSTLLNAIAGFSLPTSGSLEVDGRPVTAPGPDRGMVFQEYALFPCMTVERNVAFGLEIRGASKVETEKTVNQLLEMLGLKEFRSLQDELLRIWKSVGKTIVFVTHSIEEAVYLGSRVVILTYRPGTIKNDVTIDLPIRATAILQNSTPSKRIWPSSSMPSMIASRWTSARV